MKEIGGYFQLDQFINNPYHTNMIELNTARNALLYLIKAKRIKKIYIPYFLCDSVNKLLGKYYIKNERYRINNSFFPIFNKELKEDEYLYIVNYYGQISNEKIIEIKKLFGNVIIDNTQSFFQKPVMGIDTIYSCRKYFGLPDGAYLFTNTILKDELENDLSNTRMIHVLGRYEGQASDYYKYFRENEESLYNLPLRKMSNLTKNILGAIDYKKVIQSRNRNFIYLHTRFQATNILDIKIPNGAFAYPYYVQNGVNARKILADKKIYIPTLWPNVLRDDGRNSIEYDYSANILPLPCDQRYTEDDMEYIVKEIKNVLFKRT